MFSISREVLEQAKRNGLQVEQLENSIYMELLKKIKDKFIDNSIKSCILWEQMKQSNALSDVEGWRYVKDLVKDNQCILFFNIEDDKDAFYVKDGETLQILLVETFGFEFYITNDLLEYLVCFNHHDTLIGTGVAYEWIDKLKNK